MEHPLRARTKTRRVGFALLLAIVALGCRGLLDIQDKALVDEDAAPSDGDAAEAAPTDGGTECCAPRFLASVGPVFGLAASDQLVFLTLARPGVAPIVGAVPKDGGEVVVAAPAGEGPRGVAFVDGFLFLASSGPGTVYRSVPFGAGGDVVEGAPGVANLAFDAAYVYFTIATGDGGIGRASRVPAGDAAAWTPLAAVPDPVAIVRDDDGLYVTTSALALAATGIWHTRLDALGNAIATEQLLAAGVTDSLATDLGAVYLANGDTRAIVRLDKDGGAQTNLAKTDVVEALAADERTVYWVSANGDVASVPKDGGPTTFHARGQADIQRVILVDDTAVYWVSANALYSAPK